MQISESNKQAVKLDFQCSWETHSEVDQQLNHWRLNFAVRHQEDSFHSMGWKEVQISGQFVGPIKMPLWTLLMHLETACNEQWILFVFIEKVEVRWTITNNTAYFKLILGILIFWSHSAPHLPQTPLKSTFPPYTPPSTSCPLWLLYCLA